MDMSMRQATRLNASEVGQGKIHWNDMGTRCLAVLLRVGRANIIGEISESLI